MTEEPYVFTDDLYAETADLRALPETHTPETLDRFRIYTAPELGEFPPVEWFPGLEGVLPRRELVGLWGPGDSYKSFTALDWACWLARFGIDVLYIAAEGVSGLKLRIAAWMKQNGVDSLPHLRVMPAPVRMHDGTDVENFVRAVASQMPAPELVVIDTLARNFVGGNENSAQDMGLFVEGAERVRHAFDCAVVVVHHSTKDGSAERGGESLRNASFAMYRFDKKGRSVRVVCERMKDAEPPKPVTLTPVVVSLGTDDKGEPMSSLVASWPYGEDLTPPLFEEMSADDSRDLALKKIAVAKDITEVVKQWGSNGEVVTQAQIVARVKGVRDSLKREVARELALDPASPVQSRRSVRADGAPGRDIDYFFEVPHPDHD